MTALTTAEDTPLVARWHKQIGRRAGLGLSPRPLAAFDVHVRGDRGHPYVPLDRLVFDVLYDPPDGGSIRFARYGGRRIPFGVSLGGVESQLIERDVALEPLHWAREERLDADDTVLLRQVLRMDARIERYARRRSFRRDRCDLPRMWAAFPSVVADEIAGDGPEFLGRVHESGLSSNELLARSRRVHGGMSLLPLPWVGEMADRAVDVLVDLRHLCRRQLFHLGDHRKSLAGYRAATEFDFVSSKFDTTVTAAV